MHLLMLTPALPYPPHQGGALRNYGILCGLHEAGHKITLLSFGAAAPADYAPLAEICDAVHVVPPPTRSMSQRLRDLLTTSQPDLTRRLMSADFAGKLSQLLHQEQFDLVQFEGLEMTGYLPVVCQQQPDARLCYDAHNAEYQLQQVIFEVDRHDPNRWPAALYSYFQARRIARAERHVCQTVDCVLAVSEEDATALRSFRPDGKIDVISNGIFTSHYNGNPKQFDLGSNVLTFTGKMDYRPNVDAVLWFAADILPQVQAVIEDAQLYIVGQQPHRSLQTLRSQSSIVLTGWVPEIHPFLQATDVYVAPLRMGSGTRLKILEAMAAGCAVVATTRAAAGLPDEVRQALVLADEAQDQAQAIIKLLKDAKRRQELGESAHAAVQAHYDWSVVIPRLLAAYRDIGLG